MQLFKYIIIIITAVYAAYTDYKYYKIKNRLTVPVSLYGFIIAFFDSNIMLWEVLVGFLLPFVIFLPFYVTKMIRAGDIKLFMCIGAVMGYRWLVNCIALSFVAGGIIAVIVLIKRKCFIKRFKKLFMYFKGILYTKNVFVYNDDHNDKEGLFPFAVSILCGVIATIVADLNGIVIFLK